jgi:hypothetical protein
MARFVSLNFHEGCSFLAAGGLGLMACFSTSLQAQQPTPTMGPPHVVPAPAVTAAATNAAPILPPEMLGRYGKIIVPSDDVAHPLKLKMPFPDVGEVKIPSQDELAIRAMLEPLSKLSDAEIRMRLEQWPAYGKMNLRDEGSMLQRIQDFRDFRTRVAMQMAHDMGLLTLTPEEKVRFEKHYWDKRLQMDRDLAAQFEPVLKAREQKLQEELLHEFSSASAGLVAQAAKTPPVPPPTNRPPQVPAPVTQNKTAVVSPVPVVPAATNAALPVQALGQSPR